MLYWRLGRAILLVETNDDSKIFKAVTRHKNNIILCIQIYTITRRDRSVFKIYKTFFFNSDIIY